MGRNRDLRRKITGLQRAIAKHEAKVQRELLEPHPDESLIAHWLDEIDAWKRQVAHLSRRLKRDW
jgi:ubiquinone biosynthesis protein UbiJ